MVPARGDCPSCRGVAPCVEVCGSVPCFGSCTPCGRGSGYADTVLCLWFVLWFGRCSQCVVMGCGPAPGPTVAVPSVLRFLFARGARLCRLSRGSGRWALGRSVWVCWVSSQLCTVHRVCRAGGVCVWCPPSAGIAGAVEVVGVAPQHVAVVLFLAILRAVQAQGTLVFRVACGWVCGAGAVVGTLRWGSVWFRFQLSSCRSLPCCLPPLGPGCVGSAGVMARAPVGRWFLVRAVYRVGGAWGECAWCVFPALGAAEVIRVSQALSPLSGCCCCRRARRCGFPRGVVVLVLLLHHVLCLCCVSGLSCVPSTWAWRYRLCVHLILRVVTCACAPYTGLAGRIPLALGFSVSWVLLARCTPLHRLRSLCQGSEPVSVSHVEELRHTV